MESQSQVPEHEPGALVTMTPARVEAFSDGVIAIAITLLVIGIKLPEPNGYLLQQLLDLWPSYLGYALSFVLIGQIWLNHHGMFHKLKSVDQRILVWNLFLLLDIAFLPLPTAVLSEALRTGENTKVAAVFYGLVMVIGGVFFNAVWWSAIRNGRRHLKSGMSESVVSIMTKRFAMGPSLYVLATCLALVNAWVSIATFVFLIVFYTVENSARPRRIRSRSSH